MSNVPCVMPPPEETLTKFSLELLPKSFKKLYDDAPAEMKSWTEGRLYKEVSAKMNATAGHLGLARRIRISFWEEYDRAAKEREKMDIARIQKHVGRQAVLCNFMEENPLLILWIVCPLAHYLLQRKEIEYLAHERMIETLSVSAVQSGGRVDANLAKIHLEMYKTICDRLYGSAVQKTQTETKAVNVNMNSQQNITQDTQTVNLITDVKEIDRRIKEIQSKREELQSGGGHPVDVNMQKLMHPEKPETHDV